MIEQADYKYQIKEVERKIEPKPKNSPKNAKGKK